MLERQHESVARAKAEGKYKGRKPTARARAAEILSLKANGIGPTEIARRLSIGRASVYRVIRAIPKPDHPTAMAERSDPRVEAQAAI